MADIVETAIKTGLEDTLKGEGSFTLFALNDAVLMPA